VWRAIFARLARILARSPRIIAPKAADLV